MRTAPFMSRFAPRGMVCAVDALAAGAGVALLRAGGNAVDAAIAASAVLTVTTQHMCGLGGDLFALVHSPGDTAPLALNASGRSGSGADAERLRAQGHAHMPAFGDIRAVPVPGCVDGWLALHARLGRAPLADVLAPAHFYAAAGFPASASLARAAARVRDLPGGADFAAATRPGALVRRPGVARTLAAIASGGRDAFYGGEFGDGLLALGEGEYTRDDLAQPDAEWVAPIAVDAWGARLWTVPPNSQGYLALAGAAVASRLELPDDPDDPLWAHLTVESARVVAFDRDEVLHEYADGSALLAPERLDDRRRLVDTNRVAALPPTRQSPGGTIYLCAVDDERRGVSLIQSNAAGFGALVAEPTTGIFLQNRGLGFSLTPGHPAEYGPRRRPPHTLSPALLTRPDGGLHTVLGTMGGDAQPQVLLQLVARLLQARESVGDAIAAARWVLSARGTASGFDTWHERGPTVVDLEAEAPAAWEQGLRDRGHEVRRHAPLALNAGHAHAIGVRDDVLEGASDPRALAGSAAGW